MSRRPLRMTRLEETLDGLARTRTARVLGWLAVGVWCVVVLVALWPWVR